MKFRVHSDALADAVAWAARALPNRPPVPILSGMLLEADPAGLLRLSSFDYEVSARVDLPADVMDAGSVLVSGKLLADISRSLPAKPVDFTVDGAKAVLVCGGVRFTLLTMPTTEYPALPVMPRSCGTFAGDVFTRAVQQVSIAASRDETLPILAGIRMEIEGETITLLTTDRYRLAVRTLPWRPLDSQQSSTVLVRARTLSETAKALGTSADVTLALSTNETTAMIGFASGGRRMTSLLVEGHYPSEVRRLLPQAPQHQAVMNTSAVINAVKRVALVAERNTPVHLKFAADGLTLQAGHGENAEASEAIESVLTGEKMSTAFNPQFLLDGLTALGTPWARISFTQPHRPAVLSPQNDPDGPADDSYRYLLQPVRIANHPAN